MKRFSVCALVVCCQLACSALLPAAGADVPWKSLFNGKNLDGWIQRGGKARYTIEDGVIVGSSVPNTPNSFLCTEAFYGDFILEIELKVDPELNSGIQIRSHSFNDYRNWRVHGYQIEIDPSERAWSGGIYDEARRGWLNPLKDNEPARTAFKVDGWNLYRVEAIGDSIKTWVNGVPAADLVDPMTQSGFIALQVHGTRSKETKQVRWRNIRIKDLGRHRWKPIFNGCDLDGWHALPGGAWRAENGLIEGTSEKSESRHGILLSDRIYDDFTVRFSFKALKGNSGFYFRSDEVKGGVGVHGFQAEIDVEKDIGGLYETGGRAWVVQPDPENVKKWFKKGEWNTMSVSAHGRRIVVHVNGQKTADLKNDPGRLKGRFGLQLHGGMDMDVQFKDIALLVPEIETDAVYLFNGKNLDGWTVRGENWKKSKWTVGTPELAGDKSQLLKAADGTEAIINLAQHHGDSVDFYSKKRFGDCRIELDVMVPKGSNSGIYVMGGYEIQVLDSYGREKMGAGDMGAIYGASPPPINASRKPGAWQHYVIEFKAPKFNEKGEKFSNAVFESVQLNGHVIHRSLKMKGCTPGGVIRQEAPTGPLMFQGNHGPVAYKDIKVFPR